MKFTRLKHLDGSFQALQDDWKAQCRSFDEDFETYVGFPLKTLSSLVDECGDHGFDGVFSLESGTFPNAAVCFLNAAYIPGYKERVLRVRHLILAPAFDIGEYNAETYARLLTDVLGGLVDLAKGELDSCHIKVHFRSPADSEVFREYSNDLHQSGAFKHVATHGAWLIVSL